MVLSLNQHGHGTGLKTFAVLLSRIERYAYNLGDMNIVYNITKTVYKQNRRDPWPENNHSLAVSDLHRIVAQYRKGFHTSVGKSVFFPVLFSIHFYF